MRVVSSFPGLPEMFRNSIQGGSPSVSDGSSAHPDTIVPPPHTEPGFQTPSSSPRPSLLLNGIAVLIGVQPANSRAVPDAPAPTPEPSGILGPALDVLPETASISHSTPSCRARVAAGSDDVESCSSSSSNPRIANGSSVSSAPLSVAGKWERRARVLRAQYAQAEKIRDDALREKDAWRARVDELEAAVAAATAGNQDAMHRAEQVAVWKERAEERARSESVVIKERDAMTKKVQQMEQELCAEMERRKEAENRANAAELQVEQGKAVIAELEGELGRQEEEILRARAQANAAGHEAELALGDLQTVLARENLTQKRVEEVEGMLAKAGDALAKRTKELGTVQERATKTSHELAGSVADADSATKRVEDLLGEMTVLRAEAATNADMVESLGTKLRQTQADEAALREANNCLRRDVEIADVTAERLRDELDEKDKEVNNAIATAAKAMDDAARSQEGSGARIRALEARLDLSENRTTGEMERAERAEARLRDLEEALARARDGTRLLRQRASNAEAEVERMEEVAELSRSNMAELEKEATEASGRAKRDREAMKRLEAELNAVTELNARQLSTMEQNKIGLTENLKAAEERSKEDRAAKDRIATELDVMKNEKASVENEITEAHARLKGGQDKVCELEMKNAELTGLHAEAIQALDEVSSSLRASGEAVAAMRKERDDITRSIDHTRETLEEAKAEISKLEQEKFTAGQKLDLVQTTLEKQQESNSVLRDQLSVARESIDVTQEQLLVARTENGRLAKELTHFHRQVEIEKACTEEHRNLQMLAEADNARLSAELNKLTATLKADNENIANELQSARQAVDESRATARQRDKQLRVAQDKIATLTAELRTIREEASEEIRQAVEAAALRVAREEEQFAAGRSTPEGGVVPDLSGRVAVLEKQLGDSTRAADRAEFLRSRAEEEAGAARYAEKRAAASLQEALDRLAALSGPPSGMAQRNEALQRELRQTVGRAEDAETQLAEARMQVERLERAIAEGPIPAFLSPMTGASAGEDEAGSGMLGPVGAMSPTGRGLQTGRVVLVEEQEQEAEQQQEMKEVEVEKEEKGEGVVTSGRVATPEATVFAQRRMGDLGRSFANGPLRKGASVAGTSAGGARVKGRSAEARGRTEPRKLAERLASKTREADEREQEVVMLKGELEAIHRRMRRMEVVRPPPVGAPQELLADEDRGGGAEVKEALAGEERRRTGSRRSSRRGSVTASSDGMMLHSKQNGAMIRTLTRA